MRTLFLEVACEWRGKHVAVGIETGNPQTSELSQSNGRQMTLAAMQDMKVGSEKSGEQRCVVDLRRRGKVSSLPRSTKTT